jgi:hypothetical protein
VFFGEKLGPRYHASRDKDFFMETDSRTADELAAAAAAKQQRSKKQIQVLVGSYDAEALREEGRAADELKKSKLVPSCACDLLLVMGTSLKVPPLFCGPRYLILLQICGGSDLAAAPPRVTTTVTMRTSQSCKVAPVSGLPDSVHWLCPRVLLNRVPVHLHGRPVGEAELRVGGDNGFRFGEGVMRPAREKWAAAAARASASAGARGGAGAGGGEGGGASAGGGAGGSGSSASATASVSGVASAEAEAEVEVEVEVEVPSRAGAHKGAEADAGAGNADGGSDGDGELCHYRDVFVPGDCDHSARQLADALGWGAELEGLVKAGAS